MRTKELVIGTILVMFVGLTGLLITIMQTDVSKYTTSLFGDTTIHNYFPTGQKRDVDGSLIKILIEDEYDKFRPEREAIFAKEQHDRGKMPKQEPLKFIDKAGKPDLHRLLLDFFDVLQQNRLSFPHPERMSSLDGRPTIWDAVFYDTYDEVLSERDLDEMIRFEDLFISDLRAKHAAIVQSLPTDIPAGLFKGSGYVVIGGDVYTFLALMAIQSLRHSGSTLPVEVIFPDESEMEPWYCDMLQSEYNAKCVSFKEALGPDLFNRIGKIRGYQFKSFALLCCSFQNAFYLDSDNLAVMNPDHLFESSLYKRYKMITWPDFWRRTTSPALYDIMDIKIGAVPVRKLDDIFSPPSLYTTKEDLISVEEKVNLHDRQGAITDWSTESGQMLLDKNEHFNTLLLSLYYNFDGPQGYHPLISQGGAGEGDKETYVLAAHYLKKPHYQVHRPPGKLYGVFIKHTSRYIDTTIVQMDPELDYSGLRELVVRNRERWEHNENGRAGLYNYDYAFGRMAFDTVPYRPMFYHVHAPKFDPWLFVKRDHFTDMESQPIRNLGEEYLQTGYDVELWAWKTIKQDLCGKYKFDCFKDRNLKEICGKEIDERIEWLDKTSKPVLESEKFDPPVPNQEQTDIDDQIEAAMAHAFER